MTTAHACAGVWGLRTSVLLSSRRVSVFVDKPTEDLTPPDHANSARWSVRVSRYWRALLKSPMRTVRVVVDLVLGQHMHELPLTEDQHPIQALATDGAVVAWARQNSRHDAPMHRGAGSSPALLRMFQTVARA